MEFNNGAELLELCQETGFPISQIMKKREAEFSKPCLLYTSPSPRDVG